MKLPYWYMLLTHFEKCNYFQNGLTIPFIIASRTILEPEEELQSVDMLISDFCMAKTPRRITGLKCGNIREFVFGLLDSETKSAMDTYNGLYQEFGNLVFTDDSLIEVKNIDGMVLKMTEIHDPIVKLGSQSKIDGVWQRFSTKDEARIKEIIAL